METARRKIVAAALAALAAVACRGREPAPALTLAPGNVEVLVDAKAFPATRFAVQELTNFLSRAFAARVPVVHEPTAGLVQIVVGDNAWSRAEGLDPDSLGKDDAFIICATTNRLYLCGVDGDYRWYVDVINEGRGGVGMMQGRRSSSFAVYEFLERYADCRFYWPGELGEIVPRTSAVSVPLGETRHLPDMIIRRYYHP